MAMNSKLRMGIVGGGRGAFIGSVHRMAAELDGETRCVAGALSSTPETAIESGREWGFADDRNYESWEQMLQRESRRPSADRLDFVSIVTPNHLHFPIAKAFIESGFNIVLDKPMVHTSQQARELIDLVRRHNVHFAVSYNYTGYPMVKQAADIVRGGHIGAVRKVIVEYLQGWLASKLEDSGQKQADWRTDPARAGIAGAVGDIGSHAENLVSTVTGLEIESLCAETTTFVPGRRLGDDAAVLLRFKGGARGILTCSQVCIGEENNLRLRVYGERGSVHWAQEQPNQLTMFDHEGIARLISRRGGGNTDAALRASRLPSGHPEGFIEAFANIYKGFGESIRARRDQRPSTGLAAEVPTVLDGARGVAFLEHVIESGRAGGIWVDMPVIS
jgi:predicted dehydrogenase